MLLYVFVKQDERRNAFRQVLTYWLGNKIHHLVVALGFGKNVRVHRAQ